VSRLERKLYVEGAERQEDGFGQLGRDGGFDLNRAYLDRHDAFCSRTCKKIVVKIVVKRP